MFGDSPSSSSSSSSSSTTASTSGALRVENRKHVAQLKQFLLEDVAKVLEQIESLNDAKENANVVRVISQVKKVRLYCMYVCVRATIAFVFMCSHRCRAPRTVADVL